MKPASVAHSIAICASLCMGLAACSGGGTDSTTVSGDVPIAYAKRASTVELNPLTAASMEPGGDLMIRATSSASAPEYNITTSITQGQGDVADPEVSFDGTKIVFALNCPTSNTSTYDGGPACTGHWNIWEYDTSSGLASGTFRRLTSSTTYDDVGPAYLPAGNGYVFSSNRQASEYPRQFVDASGVTHQYQALDEYERQTVFNLHTMDANGGTIQQISFNQSHDRNPVVRPDGTIMFSRWEHVADRNRFTIFTVNPNGTNMFVLYGAHADGNSFLHPRDMDPGGSHAGYIVSDLMPLDRTQAGGALMLIDSKDYSDQNNPINSSVPNSGGQAQMTTQSLNYETGLSQYGRVTTPYPLWDGTDRILVSFAPCQVTNAGVVVSCTTLSATEIAALSDPNRLLSVAAKDPVQNNVPPSYAVYMFDPSEQTWLLVAAPPTGFMYTDPIALQARAEPVGKTTVNPSTSGTATIAVQSVFDTDMLGRMGQQMLTAADLPSSCTNTSATPVDAMIPQTPPLDSQDTRPTVANLIQLKDPANSAYNCSPIRFVRVVRAIAPPSGMTGERQAIGDTNFEQNEILGYAPVEPDGSFQITVPADTPIGFSVLDSKGRAFQVHTNWIQARSGEIRTCDGCHSPRRGAAINSGTVSGYVPAAWVASMQSNHQPGDTMASEHVRLDATQLQIQQNMSYTDVWADSTKATPRASITIDYSGLVSPEVPPEVTPTGALIINYPDQIQPIWNRSCVSCHTANDSHLNLTSTIAGTGRMTSYENLMLGAPVLDSSGNPVLVVQDGEQVVELGPAMVYSMASEGQAVGLARQSRLIEILAGQTLMSSAAAQTAFPTPTGTVNHATLLNASEMRLITEWIDLGGKYYNDPFSSSGVLNVNGLSQTTFTAQVYPILLSSCAANCHMARGSDTTVPGGTSFLGDKFVLTGNPMGDYNNTLTMISDACNVSDPANYLLSMPSSLPTSTPPHPASPTNGNAAVMPAGSSNYSIIANWIHSGCP